MNEMIASYLNSAAGGNFVCQVITIFAMFLFGCLIVFALSEGRMSAFEIMLSFPVGISVYSLACFIMLIMHVSLKSVSVTGALSVIAVLCVVYIKMRALTVKLSRKTMIIFIITLLCIAVISTSGLLPVSISNDSLYYYSMYPSAMTHYGELRKQFNVFLTDVGQTSAIVNTLPFMYGFNEGFGIQWFMNINTLLIVVYALKERCRAYMNGKRAWTAALIMAGVLVTSMPYVIMSRWAMSNGYFMCFMFICVYTALRYSGWECPGENYTIGSTFNNCVSYNKVNAMKEDANKDIYAVSCGQLVIQGILFTMLAFLRMEGCIVALIMLLCISTIKSYTNRQLFGAFLLPVLVLSATYDIRIFYIMEVDAPYTFLTKTKALIQIAAIMAVGVYLLFIRGAVTDRILISIRKRLRINGHSSEDIEFGEHKVRNCDSVKVIRILILTGLVFINVLLFLYDRTLYLENMNAFIANISNQSGWGLFPMLIIGIYAMCAVVSWHGRNAGGAGQAADRNLHVDTENPDGISGIEAEPTVRADHMVQNKICYGLGYEDLCFVAYLLTALAVSFARDDALRESIGDSGNRVLLQGTLLAFYAAAMHVVRLLHE